MGTLSKEELESKHRVCQSPIDGLFVTKLDTEKVARNLVSKSQARGKGVLKRKSKLPRSKRGSAAKESDQPKKEKAGRSKKALGENEIAASQPEKADRNLPALPKLGGMSIARCKLEWNNTEKRKTSCSVSGNDFHKNTAGLRQIWWGTRWQSRGWYGRWAWSYKHQIDSVRMAGWKSRCW